MDSQERVSILESVFEFWPWPESRDFAELADPRLFAEVLEVTREQGSITLTRLISETEGLRRRLRRLWVVDKPTKTTIKGLLSAMKNFGWLQLEDPKTGRYALTIEGFEMQDLSKDEKAFRRKLAEKMHARYVIPGWLVSRLMDLNPRGQGEILLPSPPKDWQPEPVPWEDCQWSEELSDQVVKSTHAGRKFFPHCFPVDDENWVRGVRESWERLSAKKPPVSRSKNGNEQPREKAGSAKFAPRGRLTQAMREAAIGLLFSSYRPLPLGIWITDYPYEKHPIPPRAFRAWCPRLDALELVFYTDSYPMISGRLILPCGAFRETAVTPPFEIVSGIKDPKGRSLYLHQPPWDYVRDEFIEVLLETYAGISKRVGALYVSLLDVRDEVCRRLRLSSILFDTCLEGAYRESIRENIASTKQISISLESDIRPEQRSGYGLLRRPVYVDKVPHSLIAISRRQHQYRRD